MRLCPRCQSGNPDEAEHCAFCGAVLPIPDDEETLGAPAPNHPEGPAAAEQVMPSGPSANASAPAQGGGISVAATAAPETAGQFGSRYRIICKLGGGGMGTVYKVHDRDVNRVVALKVVRPELAANPEVMERFKQELLLARKISHKNILRIHDLGDHNGMKFISMAYVEGHDLSRALKEQGRLPIDRAVRIACQLCAALDAAESEGVVHRDLKPQNILLDDAGNVYVSDFGLAKSLDADLGMTFTGQYLGTPRYMSPEQAETKPVDHRSDIYSLGLILYEMVTGDLPFKGGSALQLLHQRVQQKPQSPKLRNPEIPEYLSRIILKCLETDPVDRYQHAREVLSDLESEVAPPPPGSMQITLPLLSRRVWLMSGSAVLAVLLAGLIVPGVRQFVFHRVTRSAAASMAPTGVPSLATGKYIAVLPFRVLGDQESLGYVAEGLVEAMSAKLFQLRDVRLASSTAASKTDPKAPLSQVAKELGVNLIVRGTVQGAGDNLRVTINLENVAENRLAWSQEFAGVPDDLLSIEDHIYTGLVDALETKPTNEEMAAASAHPTENVEAYSQYLKGRNALSNASDEKTIQAAMNYFTSALQKDPEFALAYTGLSDADRGMYEEKKDKYWSARAVEAAKQAAQLNDKLPEVHFALGGAYAATGQNAQAIAEEKRALELAPNSDEGYRRLGNAYKANGQKEEALQALEKAVEINPYYWTNLTGLGIAYSDFGEFDKALKIFTQIIQLKPDDPVVYSNLGATYFSLGRYDESIKAYQTSLQIRPDAVTYANLGTSFFYLKRYSEAVPMFEKAVEMSPEDEMNMGNLADGYRLAGDRAKAQATYEKAVGLAYDALRVNPRDATVIGHLALYYAKKGDPQQARQFIKKARAIDRSNVYLGYIAAVVDTIDNHPADAVKELTMALEKGFSPRDVEMDPEFGPLQSRPDFQSMLKRSTAKTR
jgi:eukaryotic-like serine/threonine-protein kinase